MKIYTIAILSLLLIISCNSLDDKIEGGWVIDQAYYNDEPVIWDLYNNAMDLNADYTCYLPPINKRLDRKNAEETGTWTIYSDGGIDYLQISTSNPIFNRTFKISSLEKVRDYESAGYLMKMTIISDSLKLDCTRAIY